MGRSVPAQRVETVKGFMLALGLLAGALVLPDSARAEYHEALIVLDQTNAQGIQDGYINSGDLLKVTQAFGPCADPSVCPQDVNGDTAVNSGDQLRLVQRFGAICHYLAYDWQIGPQEQAFIDALNTERVAVGANPVTVGYHLQKAATTKAEELANSGSALHSEQYPLGSFGPLYTRDFRHRLSDCGYGDNAYALEEIPYGSDNGAGVVEALLFHPDLDHQFMLLQQYTHIGVSLRPSTINGWQWCIVLASLPDEPLL